MKFDLMITDLDGTLLTREGHLLPSTLATLRKLAASGCLIATASARTVSNTAAVSNSLDDLCCARACVNGAYIRTGDGRILADESMDADAVNGIFDFCAGLQASVCCAASDAAAAVIRHPECRHAFELIHARLRGDWTGNGPDFKPALLMVYADTVQPLLDFIRVRHPGLDASPVSAIPRHGREYVFVQKHGVHKGSALRRIADFYQVDPARTLAFGDALSNDGPLLAAAGTGVAMANGNPRLREKAHHVTSKDHSADGVGDCLRERFGIGAT